MPCGKQLWARWPVMRGLAGLVQSLITLSPPEPSVLKRGATTTMSELRDECGVAAIYHLPGRATSPLCPEQGPEEASRLVPRMLLDIQNRGQLSAGMTTFNPERNQLIDTYKELGGVSEVFRLSHRGKYESLMSEYAGRAAIGHVRYATCGAEDRSYAQPFERHHLQKHKWFSFAFNGQLANYQKLRRDLLTDGDNHLARETDTEIILHEISRELSGDRNPSLVELWRNVGARWMALIAWSSSTRLATCSWCAIRWASNRCATPWKDRCSRLPARAWRS